MGAVGEKRSATKYLHGLPTALLLEQRCVIGNACQTKERESNVFDGWYVMRSLLLKYTTTKTLFAGVERQCGNTMCRVTLTSRLTGKRESPLNSQARLPKDVCTQSKLRTVPQVKFPSPHFSHPQFQLPNLLRPILTFQKQIWTIG